MSRSGVYSSELLHSNFLGLVMGGPNKIDRFRGWYSSIDINYDMLTPVSNFSQKKSGVAIHQTWTQSDRVSNSECAILKTTL